MHNRLRLRYLLKQRIHFQRFLRLLQPLTVDQPTTLYPIIPASHLRSSRNLNKRRGAEHVIPVGILRVPPQHRLLQHRECRLLQALHRVDKHD